MFSQQLTELGDAALLILREMIVNVPAQVVAPEIFIIFLARLNEPIQRVHAEFFRVTQFAAHGLVFNSATQRPDGVNERQVGQFKPGFAQVENFMRMRGALKINRPVADEQDKILFRGGLVIIQRDERGLQAVLGKQDLEQVHARERGGVAEYFGRLGQRFPVREDDAVDFAQ